jgi:hypothetical protein
MAIAMRSRIWSWRAWVDRDGDEVQRRGQPFLEATLHVEDGHDPGRDAIARGGDDGRVRADRTDDRDPAVGVERDLVDPGHDGCRRDRDAGEEEEDDEERPLPATDPARGRLVGHRCPHGVR